MRPLELTLEGFNSYREAHTFSFDGRTLFGIVGPTGSGKSSILDGIIYALYGKTPRIERSTKMLINSAVEMARVTLLFEVAGGTWQVTRALRRKGQSQIVLQDQQGQSPPVTGESNVNEVIEELVGLDFKAFLSTVSLPQGEFDRFLHAAPSDRSRILKGIFRLDRVDKIRELTKRRLGEVEGKILVLQQAAAGLPEDPESKLVDLREELALAKRDQEEINAILPEISRLESQAQIGAEQLGELDRRQAEIESILLSVPEPDSLRTGVDAVEAASEAFTAAALSLEDAMNDLSKSESNLVTVEASTGGSAWINSVESMLAEQQRLSSSIETLQKEIQSNGANLTDAQSLLASERKALEEALSKVERTRSALAELNRVHAAHLLRDELVPGGACPVCEQQVDVVPKRSKMPTLEAVEQELALATTLEQTVRARASKAEVSVEVARDRLQTVSSQVAAATSALEAVSDKLQMLIPADVDASKELAVRSSALADAQNAVVSSRERKDAAEKAERIARSTLDAAIKALDGATRALIRISGALNIELEVSQDFGLLPGVAKKATEAAEREIEALSKKKEQIHETMKRAQEVLAGFKTRFAAESSEAVSEVLARVSQRVSNAAAEVAALEELIARREEAEKQIKELVESRGRLERLATDFTDSRFTKYLLDGQRRVLSRLGSEKLLELTGHYRFDDDGEFNVVDTRTGMTRHPDTLSGGETFLASLALALALAEAVALEGGRLGCFFLDEGFGSLDAESLDLALDGIERLESPGRVIGLISHVGGIQARLDDLIVLDRESDGSTVVVQYEGPLGYAQGGL